MLKIVFSQTGWNEYNNIFQYTLIEKNKNPFEVLPLGWISINHRSGLPVYMHKATKVVTFSRPYYIGRRPLKVWIICQYFVHFNTDCSLVGSNRELSHTSQ